jgi:hypothetical protein
MKRHATSMLAAAVLLSIAALGPAAARAADNALDSLAGAWEGPWYRGMTSGKVKIVIDREGGSIQFTNLDNFGDAAHPLTRAALEAGTFTFRTEGEKGGTLSAALNVNEAATQMKGMGKFDGFPLRFEIKRAGKE